MGNKKTSVFWSGGKDSAMAVYELRNNSRYYGHHVTGLLTTLTEGYNRISGHGIRRTVLERQAACLGLPVHTTYIPKKATMDDYNSVIESALITNRNNGMHYAATGDIFIEKRRMSTFKRVGVKGCFPLMRKDTREHVAKFIQLGFKAYIVCVDAAVLDKSFVGTMIDNEFLERLPTGIDPCGEHGEFHTFVFAGPLFREQVKCKLGEIVFKGSFYFCDVLVDD